MSFEYRILSRPEIARLGDLRREESIDRIYHTRDGTLVLENEHWDVPDWSPRELQRRIATLERYHDEGATLFGAFDGTVLAGLAVLGPHPLPTGVGRLELAGLWVSRPCRGIGIGGTLFESVAQAARELGAKALYVSATSTENTVRFYLSHGCRLADPIDPDLYEQEPDDIHLELCLT